MHLNTNVFFHGTYEPQERLRLASATDLIHNLYENDAQMGRAMPNKFYDGIALKLPQLVNVGSFVASEVTTAGVGLACDPHSPSFADDVFDYFSTLTRSEFEHNCDRKLRDVLQADQQAQRAVQSVIDDLYESAG